MNSFLDAAEPVQPTAELSMGLLLLPSLNRLSLGQFFASSRHLAETKKLCRKCSRRGLFWPFERGTARDRNAAELLTDISLPTVLA